MGKIQKLSLLVFILFSSPFVLAEQPKTPAVLFADFLKAHPSEADFVQSLDQRLQTRFNTEASDRQLLDICHTMANRQLLNLNHKIIQELAGACEMNNAAQVRDAFTKINGASVRSEFERTLRSQIQRSGGLQKFGENFPASIKDEKNPLLAFGIFSVFGI